MPPLVRKRKPMPRMETHLIKADDRLSRVFSHFYVVRQTSEAPTVSQQLLPNYEMLLVFNFGSELPIWLGKEYYTIQRVSIIGPLQTLLRYNLQASADLMVVVFTLNGFYRLFGQLLRQSGQVATDVMLELAALTNLWIQLANLSSTEERTQCFSDFAARNLTPMNNAMQPLLDTIPHFRHTLVDPIKAVAQQHDLSARTLQLRFQHQVGYSGKAMIRFVRFKALLAQLLTQQPTLPDWADLVVSYGYYDQSHLVRDFKFFTGLAPSAFMKQLAEQSLCMSQPGKFY